jgi:hypothetical protein
MMGKTWIVSLQDGENPTYVILDAMPVVILVEDSLLDDPMWSPPSDCTDTDHIHIKDLLENSHWNDTCESVKKNKE